MNTKKSLAMVGIGRWGKNLLREFDKITNVKYCHHLGSLQNSTWLKNNYPHIRIVRSLDQILNDSSINAVVVATPIATHYKLAKKILLADKDVFIEKPLVAKVDHTKELNGLAKKKKRILFVGHTFSYHPVLARIKQIGRREPITHLNFSWHKLGSFGESITLNLGCHDIATSLDIFGQNKLPKIISSEGRHIISDSDVMFLQLEFSRNRSSTIYINRVSSIKNKSTIVVTTKNIYLWENDLLSKFDKKNNKFKLLYTSKKTPLEIECAEFIKCLKTRKKPITDGEFGLKVVEVLAKV